MEIAQSQISERIGKILHRSGVYSTEPWEMQSENYFLNQALCIATTLVPEEVLSQVLSIEEAMGRNRALESEASYSNRIIDIDIMYYDDLVIKQAHIEIPHPRLQFRRFALTPLAEIAPDTQHPVLKRTQVELLAKCTDSSYLERI